LEFTFHAVVGRRSSIVHRPSSIVHIAKEYYMPIVLIATTNPGKLREYRQMFESVPGASIVSPNDVEVWAEIAETGDTFEENALLKARGLRNALPEEARAEGVWVLGDDSGLEVDAMGGGPGVLSNRWAGPDTTAQQRNEALLKRLQGVPDPGRMARFRCVIALISPAGNEYILDGTVQGRIAHEPKGDGGFGYDPIFELHDGRRMSELSPDEKNRISHRGIAGTKAAEIVRNS
jgi:XTP/dITP diphosphohydrolase